ncbi:MAG: hypothetical protein LBH46_02275 [Rickettsiales bacterium]|jgi:hypothetical protein|nr:hypothetical protein [Rickettsiales bacterium]
MFFISVANANPLACAVCTIAIAGGLGIAKKLGVSEASVGVWVGAMLFALSQWTVEFLIKKNIKNKYIHYLMYPLWFCTVIPLYLGETPSIIFGIDTFMGIDTFLFSLLSGIVVLVGSIKYYRYLKTKNGKPHFKFEKVVLPILSLVLISVIYNFYL